MKSPKVFLIHGFEGIPNGGWRPYLMSELAGLDVYCCSLPMPTPESPLKEEWVDEIGRAVGAPDENVFLVGHSLGVPAILHYLQAQHTSAIGGAVLVSGPFGNTDDADKILLESFFEPAYDFSAIKNNCKKFAVIHGDNDPVVPFSDAQEFSKALSCELIPIKNGGHLNGSSGFRTLPEALEVLKNFLKPTN